jgi:hypothetical protein
MSLTKLVLISGLALFEAASSTPSLAQGGPYAPRLRHVGPRIEITPRPYLYPRLHRHCVERLELQYRPSGPVLYPQTYCWWARG